MMPIGPAPVISTSSPSTSNWSAVCTALPNGSKIAWTSRGMLRVVDPDVGHRQRQVLGERPGAVDADALGVLAQVPPAGQAVAAPAADDVPLAADDLADVEVLDVRADLDDLAHELVADHHRHRDRLLRPGVPLVDVHVGAADPGPQHLDQHVVDADPGTGTSSSQRPGLASFFTRASIVSMRTSPRASSKQRSLPYQSMQPNGGRIDPQCPRADRPGGSRLLQQVCGRRTTPRAGLLPPPIQFFPYGGRSVEHSE